MSTIERETSNVRYMNINTIMDEMLPTNDFKDDILDNIEAEYRIEGKPIEFIDRDNVIIVSNPIEGGYMEVSVSGMVETCNWGFIDN